MHKKNSIKFTLLSALFYFSNNVAAQTWHYQTRGYISAKLSSYTEDNSHNYGQLSRAQFEQTTELSNKLWALNQLRWSSNSINTDLSTKSIASKKDQFEAYLGENYIRYKSDSWVAQIGYQEIIWGDAFGFNYADIINPKDQRETFFSDASDARLPLLLFNGKSLFSSGDFSGSLQVLFSPEPRFSKTLPLDIFIGNIFPQETLSVSKEKTPKIFSKTEFGGKISGSYNGYDMSIFSFSYLDREPIYAIENLTATNIALKEEHNKLKTTGLSFTKTVFDFVLRTDLVYSQNKYINYLENFELTHFTTNSLDTVISLDSPSYNDYSAVLVLARSNLGNIKPNSFREQTEQYLIGKIAKNLGKERSLEFSYTHEFEHPGHSIQTFLNWPITNQTELKIGGEFYFGDEQSNLSKFKKINSLFFSIKNYFQL